MEIVNRLQVKETALHNQAFYAWLDNASKYDSTPRENIERPCAELFNGLLYMARTVAICRKVGTDAFAFLATRDEQARRRPSEYFMVAIMGNAKPILAVIRRQEHQITTQPVLAPTTGLIHSLLVTVLKYCRELFAVATPFGSTIPESITWIADANDRSELSTDT